jgi:hypothetical protein
MKNSTVLLILMVALFSSGCANFNFDDTGTRVAIQVATGQYIESSGLPSERAQSVIDEVNKARTFLDVEFITVEEIAENFKQRLVEKGLSPSEMVLAITLIDMIQASIDEKIDVGQVSPEYLVRINGVLNIVEDMAKVYL